MKSAIVSLFCPAMKVTRIDSRTEVTAVEPMTATIRFDDASILVVENVTIPSTMCRRQALGRWLVDPCRGNGKDLLGNEVGVNLPAENVVFDIMTFTIIAKSIPTVFDLTLADGSVYRGTVVLPDCTVDLFTQTAEPITGTGTITLQEN